MESYPPRYLYILACLCLVTLASCSLLESDASGSVSFRIDGALAERIAGASYSRAARAVETDAAEESVDSLSEKAHFEISLKGDYTATQTIPVAEGNEAVFDDIPVGSNVYAEAVVYQSKDDEKIPLYTGKSETVTIREGDNHIELALTKAQSDEPEPADPTKPTDPSDPSDPDPTDPTEPEPADTSLHIYVSASADAETADGTQAHPFATIAAAAEYLAMLSDSENDYTISISGTLSGAQTIPATLTTSNIQSLTLAGVTGNSVDALDGGFISENAGTTLTILTGVPITIKNLKVTGGYSTEEGGAGGVVIGDGSSAANVTFGNNAIITENTSTAKSSGGGVILKAKSTLTMQGNAVVSSCKSTYSESYSAGGIYSKGTLVLQGSASVAECTASYYGGGISLSGGTVTMNENASIHGCTATRGGGGGNFIMNESSSVYGCKATGSSGCGGAVYINDTSYNGTFTLNGGTVEGNSAYRGGGVYIATWGNIVMTGGSIQNNTVSGSGAGVWLENGGKKYLFTGGTISGNAFEANSNAHAGTGIYTASNALNFFITLGGSFQVLSDNDINIGSASSGIAIASELTNAPVATITLGSYTENRQILTLASGAETTLAAECAKFAITDNDATDAYIWNISDEGLLQKSLLNPTQFYVSASGNDTTGDGASSNPFATLAGAAAQMTDADSDYTIIVNGTLSGAQTIPATLSGDASDETATAFAKSLTITGANALAGGVPQDGIDGGWDGEANPNTTTGTMLTIETTVPMTIKNLKISGAYTAGYGGGISIKGASSTNRATLTIEEGTLITQNYAGRGGGVYADCWSDIYIKGGIISNNTGMRAEGSALYLCGGTSLTMTSGSITGNTTTNQGTIYAGYDESYGGSSRVTISGGEITDNTGCGLYVNQAEATLSGTAKISGNTTSSFGGGVYLSGVTDAPATLTIEGNAEISGNTAGSGGGIYLGNSACTATMNGGTISGNEATSNGSGVYSEGTFSMSGSALVADGNDIYLASGTVAVGGALTQSHVVKIVTEDFADGSKTGAGNTVLSLASGATTTLASVYNKFTVPIDDQNGTNVICKVGSDGVVTAAKDAGDIIFTDGTAVGYNETLSLTDAQKAKAAAVIFYSGTDCSNAENNVLATRTLGVGLQQTSGIAWCTASANAYNTNIMTIQCSYSNSAWQGDVDGSDNFAQIGAFLSSNNSSDDTSTTGNYPAFDWANSYASSAANLAGTSYESGWYIPTARELYSLYSNVVTVNKALGLCGGTKFLRASATACSYWSSSQTANENYATSVKSISTYNGLIEDVGKNFTTGTSPSRYCAIRAF